MALKLNDKHPTFQKIRQLEQHAQELGLSIHSYGDMYIKDETNGMEIIYKDLDSGENLSDFPSSFETKLIIHGS